MNELTLKYDILTADNTSIHDQKITTTRSTRWTADTANIIRCEFSDTHWEDFSIGVGPHASTYTDCTFDSAFLRATPGGNAIFRNCSFRGTTLHGWDGEVSFINCVFTGELVKCLFRAEADPIHAEIIKKLTGKSITMTPPRHELVGNDFTTARLHDVDFRCGYELNRNTWPGDGSVIIRPDGQHAIDVARQRLAGMPQSPATHNALSTLDILERNVKAGQNELYVDKAIALDGDDKWAFLRTLLTR